jgi:hypothetical protein
LRASPSMPKRITLSLAAVLLFACALPVLAADPTSDQIYQALRAGNLASAQQMISQVLRDNPRSARAHFVAAEVDARAGNLGLARQELQTAESLKPGLPFESPRSVHELQQQLGESPLAVTSIQPPIRVVSRSSHLGLFLLLIGGAVVLWLWAMGSIPVSMVSTRAAFPLAFRPSVTAKAVTPEATCPVEAPGSWEASLPASPSERASPPAKRWSIA